MCCIFALLSEEDAPPMPDIPVMFARGKPRGPDASTCTEWPALGVVLGVHRLAIHGLTSASNQPIVFKNAVLICHGAIYNHRELFQQLCASPTTPSDCEIILHLYHAVGMPHTLSLLDGVFAFVLLDLATQDIFVARDPLGVRPLYEASFHSGQIRGVASEAKCLNADTAAIFHFPPGTYSRWNRTTDRYDHHLVYYRLPQPSSLFTFRFQTYFASLTTDIAMCLQDAVWKRCATSERPVACLLSGGLDSSVVAAFAQRWFLQQQYERTAYPRRIVQSRLETFSIGLANSEELHFAQMVAQHLDTLHTSVVVTEDDMFGAIEPVIHAIESYDPPTVRASIGNYLLGQYIARHSKAKTVLTGDGADELFGGHVYIHQCPNVLAFERETRRLLQEIHWLDVLRSDKSIACHGLETRIPFLDRHLVQCVLTMVPQTRRQESAMEKHVLRHAIATAFGTDFVPEAVLWRRKESHHRFCSPTLTHILQERIALYYQEPPSEELERLYYKDCFDRLFARSVAHIVPPSPSHDCARTLAT